MSKLNAISVVGEHTFTSAHHGVVLSLGIELGRVAKLSRIWIVLL